MDKHASNCTQLRVADAARTPAAVDPGNPMAPYMFPWERSVLAHGGEAGKIDSWTKAYWAVFVTAMIGYVAYDLSTTAAGRPKNKGKTEEELEWEQNEIKRIEEERVRQVRHACGQRRMSVERTHPYLSSTLPCSLLPHVCLSALHRALVALAQGCRCRCAASSN